MASSVPAEAIESRLRTLNPTSMPVYLWEEEMPEPSTIASKFIVLEFPGGGFAQQASMGAPGNNWWHEQAVFLLHVYYKTASDTSQVRVDLDALAALFRGKQFDGVTCRAPNPPVPGDGRKGRWQAMSISVPYYYRLTA